MSTALHSVRGVTTGAKKRSASRKELRERLWPDVSEEDLWIKPKGGFSQIPKCFPQIALILNKFSKGKPLSSTYLSLFCNYYEVGVVEVTDRDRFAFESGFTGERAVTSWASRMKVLEELGFIKGKEIGGVAYKQVLLMCPYKAVEALYDKEPKDALYDSYSVRFLEVKAS